MWRKVFAKMGVSLWRSPLSQTHKKFSLRSPLGKKERWKETLLRKIYSWLNEGSTPILLETEPFFAWDTWSGTKKMRVMEERNEKKKDIPHTKFRSFQKGSGSMQVGEMSNSFPPAPQNSRDESWARQCKLGMVYFFNNAPLQVPSCPLAGKALQLSLSLFPYFWAGLFSTLIHQGSLLGRTGLGITQCKVGLWLYPLFRVMSCVYVPRLSGTSAPLYKKK